MSGKRLLLRAELMWGGGRMLSAGCGELMYEDYLSKRTFVSVKGVLDDGS